MKAKRTKLVLCCCTGWFIATLVLAIIFIALFTSFPYAISYFIAKEAAIVPGSAETKAWITPPVPLYARFDFFNITNPDEISAGAKPDLKDIGPFWYKYYRNKFNVSWIEDESRVSYSLDTYYVEDLDISIGDPRNYTITTLNLPLLGVLVMMERDNLNELEEEILNFIIKHGLDDGDLFIKKTVQELLWGYQDPLLHELKRFGLSDTDVFALETNHSTNDSQGISIVNTGKYDPKMVGQFTQWNNLREIAPWNSTAARQLDGTGGYMFHTNVKKSDTIRAFVTELFRSGDFIYNYTTHVEGIKLYRFVVAPHEFENATTYPPNYGYSAFGKPGVMNLTAVFPGNSPVFVSKPHFLDADPSYLAGVNGLHPNRSIHEAFLEVEPLTGATMHAAKRLQFCFDLRQNSKISQLKNIPERTMLPWFYAAEESVITKEKADELKRDLLYPIQDTHIALMVFMIVCSVLAIILFIGTIYMCLKYRRQKTRLNDGVINSTTPLLSPSQMNQSENNST